MKRSIYCLLVLFLILGVNGIAFGQTRGTSISKLPYTIEKEGVYYLSKNLEHTKNDKDFGGITVEADNVTIDLSGFSLTGYDDGSLNEYYGIYMNGRYNIEIKNGTLKNWSSHGIYEANNVGYSHRLTNIRAVNNGGKGIYLLGNSHIVKECTLSNNGSHGLEVSTGSLVIGNVAFNNGGSGLFITTGCTVKDNTVSLNQQYGIALGGNNLVDGNTAFLNNLSGGPYSNIGLCPSCTFGKNHAPL
jgi:parallel beta-helix repeat protein